MNRPPSARITIIGSGAWGTTLALLANDAGHAVRLHVRDATEAATIRTTRENQRHLPGHHLPAAIDVTADLVEANASADVILLAVPSQAMRDTARQLQPHVGSAVVVSATKGFEQGSLLRMTQVIRQEIPDLPDTRLCALSGPNLSAEIAAGKPATTVVAGSGRESLMRIQEILSLPRFRVYTNHDLVGVEVGGALKNVIAIGAGIADGLEAGDNARAAFITRGLAEIARLGIALGAHPLTFAGLSGLGDLIATATSSLSRNHFVGQELAKGRSWPEIQAGMTSVAEGVPTTVAACALARREGIEMPIAEQIEAVLFTGKSPLSAIAELMQRDAADELQGLRAAVPSLPPETTTA